MIETAEIGSKSGLRNGTCKWTDWLTHTCCTSGSLMEKCRADRRHPITLLIQWRWRSLTFSVSPLWLRRSFLRLTCTDTKRATFVASIDDVFPNVTLMRNGFIGSSPLAPTVAISIRTLAAYRQTHRVCPRLSIQAEVRKLCHLHAVSLPLPLDRSEK
jgi:hypothetical protein